MLFNGDLRPGVRPEEAKDRLAHLFQVDYGTLEDLFQGGGVCVVREGLNRAMAERYLAAFEAAGALCRLEACPRRSRPYRWFWSVRRFVIWAAPPGRRV